jgi:hypothetical protein
VLKQCSAQTSTGQYKLEAARHSTHSTAQHDAHDTRQHSRRATALCCDFTLSCIVCNCNFSLVPGSGTWFLHVTPLARPLSRPTQRVCWCCAHCSNPQNRWILPVITYSDSCCCKPVSHPALGPCMSPPLQDPQEHCSTQELFCCCVHCSSPCPHLALGLCMSPHALAAPHAQGCTLSPRQQQQGGSATPTPLQLQQQAPAHGHGGVLKHRSSQVGFIRRSQHTIAYC